MGNIGKQEQDAEIQLIGPLFAAKGGNDETGDLLDRAEAGIEMGSDQCQSVKGGIQEGAH